MNPVWDVPPPDLEMAKSLLRDLLCEAAAPSEVRGAVVRGIDLRRLASVSRTLLREAVGELTAEAGLVSGRWPSRGEAERAA